MHYLRKVIVITSSLIKICVCYLVYKYQNHQSYLNAGLNLTFSLIKLLLPNQKYDPLNTDPQKPICATFCNLTVLLLVIYTVWTIKNVTGIRGLLISQNRKNIQK